MKHFAALTASALAAMSNDYAEYQLSDWLDGDERTALVRFSTREPDQRHEYHSVTINGAVIENEERTQMVVNRDGFADLIGARFVDRIEASKREELE